MASTLDQEISVAPAQIELPKKKRGRPRKFPLDPKKPAKKDKTTTKTTKTKTTSTKKKKLKSATPQEQAIEIDDDLIDSSLIKKAINANDYEESCFSLKNPLTVYGSSRATTNFDLRTLHFHGFNSKYSNKLKLMFQNQLDSTILPINNNKIEHSPNSNKFPKLKDVQLIEIDYKSLPHMSSVINTSFNDDNNFEIIGVNGMRSFPINDKTLRKGIVLNTGGIPIISKWYPYSINGKRYLFVNIVSSIDELSEGNFENSGISLLNIYQCSFDDNGPPLNLWKSIKLNSYFKEIHFTKTKNEGILMGVLGNGSVDIWNLNQNFFNSKSKYIKVIPSLNIEFPEQLSKITCATIVDNSTILVAGTYGLIGKYTLPNLKADFIQATRLPTISSITCKGSNESILLTSLDSNYYLIESFGLPLISPTIIEAGSTRDFIFNQRVLSLPINDSYLLCDWPLAIKVITDRDPQGSQRAKIGGDGEVWSIGKETDVDTGLITIGLSNGSLKIINVCNYLSAEERKIDPISIRLYQLNKIGDKYSLDLSFNINSSSDVLKEGVRKNLRIDEKDIKVPRDDKICNLSNGICEGVLMSTWANGLISIEQLLY